MKKNANKPTSKIKAPAPAGKLKPMVGSLIICKDSVHAFSGKSAMEAWKAYQETDADHNSLQPYELEWFVAEPHDVRMELRIIGKKHNTGSHRPSEPEANEGSVR